MEKEMKFKFLMTKDGKLSIGRILLAFGFLALFLIWRVSTMSVYDSDRILAKIKEEVIDDFRQEVYKNAGYYDEGFDPLDKSTWRGDGEPPALLLADVQVTLNNVSMSAPLFSWGSSEQVVVRYDYTLTAGGETKKSAVKQFVRVERKHGIQLWPSSSSRYYMNYL